MKTITLKLSNEPRLEEGQISHTGFAEKKLVLIHDLHHCLSFKQRDHYRNNNITVHIMSETKNIMNCVYDITNAENAMFELTEKFKLNKKAAKKAIKVEAKKLETKEEPKSEQQVVDSAKIHMWLNAGWEIDTSKIVLKKVQ